MQDRHSNDKKYFHELAQGTADYVIPYIDTVRKITWSGTVVLEVGCGHGGNLLPFADMGCKVVGIDKNDKTIGYAREFFHDHKNAGNIILLNDNFYEIDPSSVPKADVVIVRDVLEHIVNRPAFFERLKSFITGDALIFVAFPPWRMPFGGHHQGLKNRFLSNFPYLHLLPCFLFEIVMKAFGEDKIFYRNFLRDEVRRTKLSIRQYKTLLKNGGFRIVKETYYLINPSYRIKFNLPPVVLPWFMKIPFVCDFYTTAHYSVITATDVIY